MSLRLLSQPVWPQAELFCILLELPPAAPRHAARALWQEALAQWLAQWLAQSLAHGQDGRHASLATALGPEVAASSPGQRVGWRWKDADARPWSLRVSYGLWPQDVPRPAGVAPHVVALAGRPMRAAPWALDCAPDASFAGDAALLALYGHTGDEPRSFGPAWALLEAQAKLDGGLREQPPARAVAAAPNRPGPKPADLCLHSQTASGWCLALAEYN
jgi:hypothetical protein